MTLKITKLEYVEAGGNANLFYEEYREGDIIPDAILNIVMERYRGYGKIRSVIPDENAAILKVDVR